MSAHKRKHDQREFNEAYKQFKDTEPKKDMFLNLNENRNYVKERFLTNVGEGHSAPSVESAFQSLSTDSVYNASTLKQLQNLRTLASSTVADSDDLKSSRTSSPESLVDIPEDLSVKKEPSETSSTTSAVKVKEEYVQPGNIHIIYITFIYIM